MIFLKRNLIFLVEIMKINTKTFNIKTTKICLECMLSFFYFLFLILLYELMEFNHFNY